jgi:hypothetical protein
MKRRWLLALVAANLAGIAVLVFAYPHLMVSPGALVPAHATLATDCFACHAPLRGASADRCMACHAVADIGLRSTQGVTLLPAHLKTPFHQALVERDCMACHSDHAGPLLTHKSRKRFSHALLQPAVRARCESCHRTPDNSLHRGLGPTLRGNCLQCHRADAWKPATFDHARLFLLTGEHDTSCETCHVTDDYRQYTCFGCHEHRPDKVRAQHEEEGIRDLEHCARCHRSADDKEGHEGGDRGGEGARRGGSQRERDGGLDRKTLRLSALPQALRPQLAVQRVAADAQPPRRFRQVAGAGLHRVGHAAGRLGAQVDGVVRAFR